METWLRSCTFGPCLCESGERLALKLTHQHGCGWCLSGRFGARPARTGPPAWEAGAQLELFFPQAPHPWFFRVSKKSTPIGRQQPKGFPSPLDLPSSDFIFSRVFSPYFSGYKGLQLLYLAMLVFKNEISIDLGVYSCLFMFRKF